MSTKAEHSGEIEPCSKDTFVTRTKVVYSGQTRHYYKATCDCGWEAKGFRVTKERAHDLDFAAHIGSPGDSDG